MHVYTITHIDSCRTYVGKAHNPARRFAEHRCPGNLKKYPNSHLYKAAAKYGWGAFDFAVVQSCASDEEAFVAESQWIEALKSDDKALGFNLNGGGEGGRKPSAETRERIAKVSRGLKRSEETLVKMRQAAARRAPPSAETRAKIGAATRARLTPEAQAKMTESARVANTGKPLSEATKQKLRQPRTEATKAKMRGPRNLSDEAKARIHSDAANEKRRLTMRANWASCDDEARAKRLSGWQKRQKKDQ